MSVCHCISPFSSNYPICIFINKIYEVFFCYAKWTVLIIFSATVLQHISSGTLLHPHLSIAPCQLWSSLPFLRAAFLGVWKISVLGYLPEFLSSDSSKAYGGLFRHSALRRWTYVELSGCFVWWGEGEKLLLILKLSLTFLQIEEAWKLKVVQVSRKINMNLFFSPETSTDLKTIRKMYFVWLLRITACLVTIQYSRFQLRLKTVK